MGVSYISSGGPPERKFRDFGNANTLSLAAAILPNRFFNTNYTLTMAVSCSELLMFDDPECNVF
jgi:hypothetical protein